MLNFGSLKWCDHTSTFALIKLPKLYGFYLSCSTDNLILYNIDIIFIYLYNEVLGPLPFDIPACQDYKDERCMCHDTKNPGHFFLSDQHREHALTADSCTFQTASIYALLQTTGQSTCYFSFPLCMIPSHCLYFYFSPNKTQMNDHSISLFASFYCP